MRVVLGALAVAGLLLGLTYYVRDEPDSYEEALQQLRAQTTPADAHTVTATPVARTDFLVSTAWEFTTDMPWADYTAWLRGRLPGFIERSEDASSTTYVRGSPGDVVAIVVEPISQASEPTLRVRVSWQASPS